MKKVIGILFGIAVLSILVLTPPGDTVYLDQDQTVETIQVDLNNIDGVEFEATEVFNPLNIAEVEISPGVCLEGDYYSEFSKDNNRPIDGLYTLYAINDNSDKRANRLYGTNYFVGNLDRNSDLTSTQSTQIGKNRKEYEEVGISPISILAHQCDA